MHISTIRPSETVSVDPDRLGVLYAQLGEAGAEDMVCRAMEELALRLSHCDRLHRAGDWSELRKNVKSLEVIAGQVGMVSFARVAEHVTFNITVMDLPAVAATLSRLLRIGERSLTEIWDIDDLQI
jgi:hypothetical protein